MEKELTTKSLIVMLLWKCLLCHNPFPWFSIIVCRTFSTIVETSAIAPIPITEIKKFQNSVKLIHRYLEMDSTLNALAQGFRLDHVDLRPS